MPGVPQGGVRAVGRDQVVVAAELGDPAVLHHRDPVGVVRGVEPVRDRDDGPAGQHRGERPFGAPGGGRVERGGRLVEDQRVRVGEDQPGQRQLLGVGGAELRARRRARCRGRRAGRRTSRRRRRQRGPQLLVGGVRRGERQVVAQRADEDMVFLGDQRDPAAPFGRVRSVTGTPPRLTTPCRGASIPASSRARVDLPAPDGPTMASRSPGWTARSMPCSTSRPVFE